MDIVADASADLELTAPRRVLLRLARLRALQPVSDALAHAATFGLPCRLEMPEVDIVRNFDRDGNIILQCLHPSAHCWDLTGRSTPCR